MGENIGNSGASNTNIESQLTPLLPLNGKTGESKENTPISNKSDATSEANIKYRLRNNSGKLTPKKLCKDSVSASNVNHLKKIYQAESVSLKTYLNSPKKTSNNASVTPDGIDDTAASTASKSTKSDTHGVKATEQRTAVKPTGQTQPQTLILHNQRGFKDRMDYENTSTTEVIDEDSNKMQNGDRNKAALDASNKEVTNPTDNEKSNLEDEIRGLESKLASMEGESMQKMFIELRIDLKKDNLKMIERLDKKLDKLTTLPDRFEQFQKQHETVANGVQNVATIQAEEKSD